MDSTRLDLRQALKVLLLGLALLAFVSCAKVPGLNRSQLSLISDDRLIPLAAKQYREIIDKERLSDDRVKTRLVRRVGHRIRRAAEKYLATFGRSNEIANYNWEFNLLDSPDANAFCLPGGKVAVYSGLLPIAKDEAGLATVIGHEVAHAIAHHGAERASQRLLFSLGAQAIDIGLSAKGVSQGTGQAIMIAYGLGGQVGVLLPYSRAHEAEADRIGLSLMAMAGYDPEEAIDFWRRMGQEAKKGGRRAPREFFSTHPADQTRIYNLQTYMGEAKSRFIPYNPPATEDDSFGRESAVKSSRQKNGQSNRRRDSQSSRSSRSAKPSRSSRDYSD
ncbi:MAG: M48 family metallopeptidase [Deltaproteobacteria bacterium]|jgi:predicted Zn-dependent protease|nr:M48 family metallopeptidase [Deltaproteobacteria bacterium]